MKKWDYVVFFAFNALGIIGIILLNIRPGNADTCTIYVGGEVYGVYSLYTDADIDILSDGIIINTVSIKDGSASMSYASCKDKICLNQGVIQNGGSSICCAPNEVIVVINNKKKAGEYDAITQ